MGKKLLFILSFLFISVPTFADNAILTAYDEAITLMNKHYFDATFSGIDWQTETKETRKKIVNSSNDDEKYSHILNLFKNLKHSHLVFDPASNKEKKDSIPYGSPKNISFNIEPIGDSWFITHVKPKSTAANAGLKMGMQILKLNDWDIKKYFDTNSAMDYYMLRNTLHFYPEATISLTVLDSQAENQQVNFDLADYSGRYQKMGLIRDPSEFEQKILENDIGYIRFSIFLVNPVRKAIEAIQKMRQQNVKGIIIDLRNNPGGVAMLSTAIAKEFCSKNYNLGIQTGRDMTLKFPVFAQPEPFKGKVVFLLNKNSASTSEVLAAGMQANGSIKVIGEKSAGMALPSVMVSLKDGSVFQYPVADFKTVNNQTIEGVGVIPDIEVSHNLKSLTDGKDSYIEAAVKLINKED